MGEEIIIIAVEVENGGTCIQVDTDKGRMFINTRDIFKALNNYLYEAEDKKLEGMGFEKIDAEAKNPNLID